MATPPPLPSPRKPGGAMALLLMLARGINRLRLVMVNLLFFGLIGLVVYMALDHGGGVQDGSVLLLRPRGRLVEQYSGNPLQRGLNGLSGTAIRQVRLRDLLRAINAAAKDQRITRIVLDASQLQSAGFAALRELGSALDRFRASGKPVLAWSPRLDQKQYYLAVHADRVLLDPNGGLMITGLASYRLFYKKLLDRLGVRVHLFRAGRFKSAAEPFVLEHASPAAKQADRFWMGDLWDEYIAGVTRRRKLAPATLRADIDNLSTRLAAARGDLARLALQEHLIDATATHAQFIAMLRRQGVPAGKHGSGIRAVNLAGYLASLPPVRRPSAPGVTVIVAEGEIDTGQRGPGSIGGQSTAALIRDARQDKRTRALVLRVNSPGGAVYPSEQIRREVALTRAAGKPVVVSMGDVAASGGYWISMNANRIFAEPNTITGSIGIFGLYYTLPGTLARFGVNSDGVATGPMAGAFDVRRPLAPKTGRLIQAIVDKGYRDFVGAVARARGKSPAAIRAIAQGRVWTGRQAWQRGLVDQLGGLGQAVAAAARLGRLGVNYPVRYRQLPSGVLDHFVLGLSQNVAVPALQDHGMSLSQALAQMGMLASGLDWLLHIEPGRPKVYAYCFCTPY